MRFQVITLTITCFDVTIWDRVDDFSLYRWSVTCHEDTGMVYWTMGVPLDETIIINLEIHLQNEMLPLKYFVPREGRLNLKSPSVGDVSIGQLMDSLTKKPTTLNLPCKPLSFFKTHESTHPITFVSYVLSLLLQLKFSNYKRRGWAAFDRPSMIS